MRGGNKSNAANTYLFRANDSSSRAWVRCTAWATGARSRLDQALLASGGGDTAQKSGFAQDCAVPTGQLMIISPDCQDCAGVESASQAASHFHPVF